MPSVDNLEFVMESLALGHTVLDQKTVSTCCRVHWPGSCFHCPWPGHADARVHVCACACVCWAACPCHSSCQPHAQPHVRHSVVAACGAPSRILPSIAAAACNCRGCCIALPPLQAHEYLLMVIDTISKDEVDALAKSLLSYLSHYNQEQQVGRLHLLAMHWFQTVEKLCCVWVSVFPSPGDVVRAQMHSVGKLQKPACPAATHGTPACFAFKLHARGEEKTTVAFLLSGCKDSRP